MLLEWRWTRALTLALLAACDRGHRDSAPPPTTTTAPAPAAKAGCTLDPLPTKLALAPKRIVAIGDLHGDLAATRAVLRTAGAIDAADRWIGGDLVVVQTGDVLDRGDDESAILELLDRLAGEARAAGGAVVELDGNHELMNAARDYRYVTPGGMRDFDGDRQRALDPGGAWAKRLARFNVVAIVGDTVFSHAGVLPEWAPQADAVNLSTRCWLDGQAGGAGEPPIALTSDDGPVWTRAYGMSDVDCAQLDQALARLGAKRMVVGHTVQENGINSMCDGKLWRIDVGLSKAYGGPIEALELPGLPGPGDTPRVLRGTR